MVAEMSMVQDEGVFTTLLCISLSSTLLVLYVHTGLDGYALLLPRLTSIDAVATTSRILDK